MVENLRQQYNAAFTDGKYKSFLESISTTYNHKPPFRVAETPIFIPKYLKKRLLEACEQVNKVICQHNFKELTKNALIDPSQVVPGEDDHTTFLQMDFGICLDEKGDFMPQMVEVQGFPTLYFFQELMAKGYRDNFDIPSNYHHLNNMTSAYYIEKLREIIVGDCPPENVILLEIEPHKQATQIDFLATAHHLGIKVICISELITEGKNVFYTNDQGQKISVRRIYNRVIFDELFKRNDLQRQFDFTKEYNVEWIGHPNWFFRISKFTMPLINSPYVPACHFLHELEKYPEDLENYVLKPLFSFAGSGVLINVTKQDLDAVQNKENYILQKKVAYAPAIKTPTEPAKCEIRMLMIWEKGDEKAKVVNNLVRISKGEMVGVRFNKDKDWVGASVGFFED
ncbi:hypothetical protein DHD32_11745 [Arenibacter sp. TNZ]|jgi:hypothetical protein|uniref:hypothetical protein n=1 Tax=Arenibacter TaxID=178469 RepID=UPI000CD40EB9|nr:MULTISPECIES: hypothetical protein [Arenibacter]MCM4172157.1 hypothetical protein [Arenibacter sp. TNZ]